jgi:hypothetical protein
VNSDADACDSDECQDTKIAANLTSLGGNYLQPLSASFFPAHKHPNSFEAHSYLSSTLSMTSKEWLSGEKLEGLQYAQNVDIDQGLILRPKLVSPSLNEEMIPVR